MLENKVVLKYLDLKNNNVGLATTKEASLYLKKTYIKDWEYTDKKKPVSKEVCFNISHSHDVIVMAIADVDIGVDVEKIREVDAKLKRYVSNDQEYENIKSDEDFFKVWTSKESLVKAQGTGIDKRPENIPALPFDGKKVYNKITYTSKQLKVEGYIISVTIRDDKEFEIILERE